jgi:hypothetical protein
MTFTQGLCHARRAFPRSDVAEVQKSPAFARTDPIGE